MSTPDVRVRLKPEGVAAVLDALRKVSAEGQKASKESHRGLQFVGDQVRGLRGLIPTLGLATVVAGFVAVSKSAIDTANAVGQLQQKVGGSVEDISAFVFAFRNANSDQDKLQAALVKTSGLLADLAAGSQSAGDRLAAVNLTPQALAGLSSPRALEQISIALAKMPAGWQRSAAAAGFFGDKLAVEILPALISVGADGIDPLARKAEKLGLLMSRDLTAATAQLNDAMDRLKSEASGLGTQFGAGFVPQLAEMLGQVADQLEGEGVNSFRKFGEYVGFTLRSIVFLVSGAATLLVSGFERLWRGIRGVNTAAALALTGQFRRAGAEIRQTFADTAAMASESQAKIAAAWERLTRPPPLGPTRAPPDQPAPTEDPTERQRRELAARAAVAKTARADELAAQRVANKASADADKALYDQGIINLGEYFRRRRVIIAREAAAEVASLRAERAGVSRQLEAETGVGSTDESRIRLRGEIAALDREISRRQLEARAELAAADLEEAAQARQLGDERLRVAGMLAAAEDDRHAAFMLNLADEIRQIRLLGARAGQSVEEVEATVTRLMAARTSGAALEDAQRRGSDALAKFDRDAQRIQNDQEAGILSSIEGQQRLIQLQASALPVLRALADETMRAAKATGSAESIERARQYADSIDQIAASFQAATNVGARFRQAGIESFQSGVQAMLQDVDKIHSIGDAFKSLARSIVESLHRIAAEILAQQATLMLLKAFGFGGLAAPKAQTGGLVIEKKAAGDLIRGPGLPIPGRDRVPILAEHNEFIVRRAKVMQPGGLEFLRAFNAGRITAAQLMRWPRFESGGLVGRAPAQSPFTNAGGGNTRILNVLDPDLVSDELATARGERAIINVITRNRNRIAALLRS